MYGLHFVVLSTSMILFWNLGKFEQFRKRGAFFHSIHTYLTYLSLNFARAH